MAKSFVIDKNMDWTPQRVLRFPDGVRLVPERESEKGCLLTTMRGKLHFAFGNCFLGVREGTGSNDLYIKPPSSTGAVFASILTQWIEEMGTMSGNAQDEKTSIAAFSLSWLYGKKVYKNIYPVSNIPDADGWYEFRCQGMIEI